MNQRILLTDFFLCCNVSRTLQSNKGGELMNNEVLIYMSGELVSLDVVVPVEHVGDFMVKFGEEFAHDDMELGKVARKVDGYYSNGGGWHVKVSVDKEQKDQLYAFIRNFSKEKNLSFRDADET